MGTLHMGKSMRRLALEQLLCPRCGGAFFSFGHLISYASQTHKRNQALIGFWSSFGAPRLLGVLSSLKPNFLWLTLFPQVPGSLGPASHKTQELQKAPEACIECWVCPSMNLRWEGVSFFDLFEFSNFDLFELVLEAFSYQTNDFA